jgi:cell wall assembly regulator SMI1
MYRDAVRQSAAAATAESTPDYVSFSPPPAIRDPACHPASRPVTVRPLDPKVRRAVDRQWRRIERWLKGHAPKTYATLGRPGKARTIAVAESQMGLHFPDSLRASLLRHNGQGAFGLGVDSSLSIREIRDTWRYMCRFDDTDLGDPRTEPWSGRMIPIHFRPDEEDGLMLVDSQVGDVSWDEGTQGMVSPQQPSYYALLRATADALERGEEIGHVRPHVVRGALRGEPVDRTY